MEKELIRVPKMLSENHNTKLVERLYEIGGSVMLDIILYLSGHHVKDLFGESWFSIEDFCKKMGYNRTKLHRKLNEAQRQELFGKHSPYYVYVNENGEEITHPIETVFEAALYKLGKENISFAIKGEDGRSSYNFVQILTKFDIKTNWNTKKDTKRLYCAVLNNQIRDSVYNYYNLGEMQDYRKLPDKDGYRLFYLELAKMIVLIKNKIQNGSTPDYTLTVDQLAKIFDINVVENKDRKKKVTKILNSINTLLSYTKFQYTYVKGKGERWAYTVSFTFSEATLKYFDECYNAVFVKNFYGGLLWRYVENIYPETKIGQERVHKCQQIKDTPQEYKKFLDWAYSDEGKEVKREVYREHFFKTFGRMPEEFGLDSSCPAVV